MNRSDYTAVRRAKFHLPNGYRSGALEIIDTDYSGRKPKIRVRCDCGTEKWIFRYNLKDTRSCGCLKPSFVREFHTKHGDSYTRTWRSWKSMLSRCRTASNSAYADYGGRGITVCDRWLSYENFRADMGERPLGTSLDRINNDGNYEPANCRWATAVEQANNKRGCRYLEYQGQRLTATQWARKAGITPAALLKRIERGASIEKALSPMRCPEGAGL